MLDDREFEKSQALLGFGWGFAAIDIGNPERDTLKQQKLLSLDTASSMDV